MNHEFDILIIGAGPAGCSCALSLAGTGLRIAVADKASFPRDKICGDALSGNAVHALKRLPDDIYSKFINNLTNKIPSNGIRLTGPNLKHIDILFHTGKEFCNFHTDGFICKRIDFDNFLFLQLKEYPNISVFENCRIEEIMVSDKHAVGIAKDKRIYAAIAVGADGINSVASKLVHSEGNSGKYLCTGLRTYYENVKGFSNDNYIELYFLKDILPGYFWMFPLPGNKANIGIGMLASAVKKKKIILKHKLNEIIKHNPLISARFGDAWLLDEAKAYSLPLFSSRNKISGNRILLAGDAASLVDPFTGEGVGNAMLSGRVAAEQIMQCFYNNNFSDSFLSMYDKKLYDKIYSELRISRTLQKLCRYPALLNLVINKANKNAMLKDTIIGMLNHADVRSQLTKPSFYLKLIFR